MEQEWRTQKKAFFQNSSYEFTTSNSMPEKLQGRWKSKLSYSTGNLLLKHVVLIGIVGENSVIESGYLKKSSRKKKEKKTNKQGI